MEIAQVRIARPTNKLAEVVRFYRDGLGLSTIGDFRGHDGYDGVMLALPGRRDHLEFTSSIQNGRCEAPTRDNLLAFYIPNHEDIAATRARLATLGYEPVEAENPYWQRHGALTFEDPDGWRVVLFPGQGYEAAG